MDSGILIAAWKSKGPAGYCRLKLLSGILQSLLLLLVVPNNCNAVLSVCSLKSIS